MTEKSLWRLESAFRGEKVYRVHEDEEGEEEDECN